MFDPSAGVKILNLAHPLFPDDNASQGNEDGGRPVHRRVRRLQGFERSAQRDISAGGYVTGEADGCEPRAL